MYKAEIILNWQQNWYAKELIRYWSDEKGLNWVRLITLEDQKLGARESDEGMLASIEDNHLPYLNACLY